MIYKSDSSFVNTKSNILLKWFLVSSVFFYLSLIFLNNIYKIHFLSDITRFFCIIILIFLILWEKLSAFEYFVITAVFGIVIWNSAVNLSSPLKFESTRFLLMSFCGIVIASGEFRSILIKILFFTMISFFIYSIFILKIDPNDVLTSSRNGISVNLLAYSLIIYLTDYLEGRKRPIIWPALSTFILSVIAVGRSGIIVATLFFIVVLFINCRYLYLSHFKRKTNKKLYIISAIIFIIICSVNIYYFIFPQLIIWFEGCRFNSEGLVSNRFDLWKEYFSRLNWERAIFGFNLEEVPMFVKFRLNMHNSFLGIWAKLGIVAFPIVLVTFLTLWYLRVKSFFLMTIFLLFLLRSSVDSVIYMKRYDFVLFSFLFVAFNGYRCKCFTVFYSFIMTLMSRLKNFKFNL